MRRKRGDIQRVVVGGEGPRHRAAGDGLHHRRFHFEIAALVEEAAHALEAPCARLTKTSRTSRVGEQIEIALAIAQLHVLQAVILLRQREHGLGEKGDGLDVHGQLAGARAEEIAGDADVVAEVEQLVKLKCLLADGIEPNVDLQPLAALLQLRKAGLALSTDGHDASGDGYLGAFGLKLLAGRSVIERAQYGDVVGGAVVIGVSGMTQGCDLLQLLLPQRKQAALEL